MADSSDTDGGTKRCTKCGEVKPLPGFWKNKQGKDGLHWHCIECKKAQARGYYYADVEKSRAYAREKGNARYAASAMLLVSCIDCGAEWLKRKDSMKMWSGRCRSCATKLAAADPAMRAAKSERARRQIEAWGGRIPNGKPWGIARPIAGAAHPRWKGGVTEASKRERSSARYVAWRKSVYQRDHYTCQQCGQVGGKLNAHHIKGWADFPDLRYERSNGVTLCKACHDRHHAKEAGERLGKARDAARARRKAA